MAQSHQSLRCSHTWSLEVDKGSDHKKQTSSPTGWLRMRVWRMSLRRTKRTIISWCGSVYLVICKPIQLGIARAYWGLCTMLLYPHCRSAMNLRDIWPCVQIRATENLYFVGPDRFLVCKTDSLCIKCILFSLKKHTLRIIYWPSYLD